MKRIAILAVLLLITPASGQTVTDGDRFQLGEERVRLWGIDAPEPDQICERDGRPVAVGSAAAATLDALLQDLDGCQPLGTDRHGWTVARCYTLGGDDIGQMLVLAGVAWDYPKFSDGDYADEEEEARENGRGNWSMDCIAPWEWRRQ
ncbi:MAG: thermonuclease family protein [Pseudomonadota bacterium]